MDSGLLRRLEWSIGDGIPNAEQLDEFLDLVPKSKGETNIASKGELSRAEFNVRRKVGELYGLHFTVRREGGQPSTVVGQEVDAFNSLLTKWARGRISADKMYRPVERLESP